MQAPKGVRRGKAASQGKGVSVVEKADAAAAVRLAAYLMSGSLRYALELADDQAVEAAPAWRDARTAAIDRCRDDLAGRPPRTLPLAAAHVSAATGDARDAYPAAGGQAPSPAAWLEPFPDDLYPDAPGPATRYEPRETIDLHFVAALQLLLPEERGLIVLHDVLGAEGDADGVPPVGLEAARTAFAVALAGVRGPGRSRPAEGEAAVMMRFIFGCESGDGDTLRALLAPGAVLQSVPDDAVHTGRDAVADRLLACGGDGTAVQPACAPGLQRLLPRRANGRLAFGVYRRTDRDQPFRAHALCVVTVDGPAVTGIVSFGMPALFPDFDLLPSLTAQGEHRDHRRILTNPT